MYRTRESESIPIGKRAVFLGSKGFAVFPVFTIESGQCSCGRTNCSSPGKHPIGSLVPQGVLNATTDPQAIREWWALYPDANIGIATGEVSGIVVLDIDISTGGDQTLTRLEERFERLPDTWCAWTGSGGVHFYFRSPDSREIRNSTSAVGPGIDVRGEGGYVVAPPSLHISGKRYRWSAELHPRLLSISEVPDWLLDRLSPRDGRSQTSKPLPTKISEGMRNMWMASAAGSMRRRGFSEDAIAAALLIENRTRCTPPLTEREVRQIARSIERYPPERMIRAGGMVA